MNDVKKILIAAISVVLVVAIVAGVSIGVLAGTVNGMKDQIADLNQTVEALQSENDAMKAEIAEATANNEKLVTAEDFEAKLAAAIGEQNQTMQALISTAVKNQIEELGVEGLTEAQVKEIINAAVANCITEDEVNELIANSDTGLTEAQVKKLITNANAGYLTYAQIVNLIDDNIYDLRNYLESVIAGVQDGLTTVLYLDAEDAVNGVYVIDDDVVANLASGTSATVYVTGDWSETTLIIDEDISKTFVIWVNADVDKLIVNAGYRININRPVNTVIVNAIGLTITVNANSVIDTLIAEDCGNESTRNNTKVTNNGEIGEFIDNADGYTVTIVGNNPESWTIVDGNVEYAMSDYGATVTISGEGAVADSAFNSDTMLSKVVIEEGITAIGNRSFRNCENLTSVTLPEGLTSIGSGAFMMCPSLTSIVIPEGVTTIGDNAFIESALTSIELPESLVEIGESGIRNTNLTKIVIPEAVTYIGRYAFRDSESLEYVYILCEDAENFTMEQNAFYDVAGDAPATKIFVANEAMKAKIELLIANDTSLDHITVKLIQNVEATPDDISSVLESVDDGAIVNLSSGTFTIPSSAQGKTLTIVGTEDTKIDVTSGLTYVNGSNITFEGVTIQSAPAGAGYSNGLADAEYTVFNNCVINGTLGLDYSCEFNNCEFNIEGNYYNVWTWGAGTAKFTDCTFNCEGKALLVYANVLDNGTTHQTVTITGCTFNDNGDDTVTGKAAIEITNTYTPVRTYDVIITDTEVNGFAQTVPGSGDFNAAYGSVEGSDIGTNVWGNKCKLPNTQINVVIDGEDVY